MKCAHTLYKRTQKTALNFSEIAEIAFLNGPNFGKAFATPVKFLINFGLFLTYFGTCSVYTVIVATNFQQVIEHYISQGYGLRFYIAALLIPLILLSWVPNLKYLAPVSMIANSEYNISNYIY